MNQFIYVLNNIVMCGYLTIDQLEMHIEVYHFFAVTFIIEAYLHTCSSLEGFSTFFQPVPNLRRAVNPICFSPPAR